MRSRQRRIAGWVAAVLGLLPLPSVAADFDRLYATLQAGNLKGAAPIIAELYEDAGASWDVTVEWRIDSYTRMFNTYDPIYEQIDIGAIPAAAEVDAYWLNWSRLLTEGRWRPAGFFHDADGARMLAAYNQFVLAAHEAGHALKYRYDFTHFERHGFAVSCREFYADILAAGLLHRLSATDQRFAALQQRYLALLAAINADVAPDLRYPPVTLAALEADCAVAMKVDQPTPERMAAYASAFFVRQAVMLGGDMPSLPDLVRTYLIPYRDAQVKIPYLDPPVPVRTVRRLPDLWFSDEEPTGSYRVHSHTIPAPAPGGHLYVVRFDTDAGDGEEPGPIRFTMRYGPAGGELRTMISDAEFASEPIADFRPIGAVAIDANQFVLMIRAKGDLLVSRYWFEDGTWNFEAAAPIPYAFPEATLARTASGRLFVIAGPETERSVTNQDGWYAYELDPLTLALREERALPPIAGVPRTIDDVGNVYAIYLDGIACISPRGTATMLAGSSLNGFRDAPGPEAEFGPLWLGDYASDMQVTATGDLLVLDTPPGEVATAVRQLDLP